MSPTPNNPYTFIGVDVAASPDCTAYTVYEHGRPIATTSSRELAERIAEGLRALRLVRSLYSRIFALEDAIEDLRVRRQQIIVRLPRKSRR